MEEGTIWAYREALADLSAEELDRGCLEAMRHTRFTPTPAEILEYGVVPREEKPLNALPPAPALTDQEAKEFFAQMRVQVPCLSERAMRADGITVITDEMRADAERKKREAIRLCAERSSGRTNPPKTSLVRLSQTVDLEERATRVSEPPQALVSGGQR